MKWSLHIRECSVGTQSFLFRAAIHSSLRPTSAHTRKKRLSEPFCAVFVQPQAQQVSGMLYNNIAFDLQNGGWQRLPELRHVK